MAATPGIEDTPRFLRELIRARQAEIGSDAAGYDALDKLGQVLNEISSDDPVARMLDRFAPSLGSEFPAARDWERWEAQSFETVDQADAWLRRFLLVPPPPPPHWAGLLVLVYPDGSQSDMDFNGTVVHPGDPIPGKPQLVLDRFEVTNEPRRLAEWGVVGFLRPAS